MKTITFLLLTIISFSLFAQSTGESREVPFQITFISPLGTNGMECVNTINRLSFNILAGYAQGLKGAEFGGLANVNQDFMYGVQFAGLANLTGGKADGVQFAGFGNVNLYDSKIAQFSGFSNVNIGSTRGFQGAGFANFTWGHSNLVQASGFANVAEDISGVQIAGFGNVTAGSSGIQIAGFGNVSAGEHCGTQIAGFSNIANGNVKGAQIAGFINVARNVNGVQLGVFNLADTVDNGIPIGFLSIVRDGFIEFETGISEGLNNYASFKIGVPEFYNIFSAGVQYLGNNFRWGVGYGIGTHLVNSPDFKINLEAISYHINEGAHWTKAFNGLQQLKVTFAGGVSENVSLFAGPTFNLMISDLHDQDGKQDSDFPPYYLYRDSCGNKDLKYWIGLSAGIKLH